jgi:hypothetical protein
MGGEGVMGLSRKDVLAGAVALLVILVVAVASNWPWLTSSITTSIIRSDLAHYARIVRRSALPLSDKLRLLDHLDALDAHFRSSPPVGLSRWRRFDAVVRELLTADPGWAFTPPGYISRDRPILLERELVKLERELGLQ